MQTALPLALKVLEDKKSVFTKDELVQQVTALCIQNQLKSATIDSAMEAAIKEGILKALEGGRLTTSVAIEREHNTVKLMQAGQNQCKATLPLVHGLAGKYLTKDKAQQSALTMLLGNKDRFVGIDAQDEKAVKAVLSLSQRASFNTKLSVVGPNQHAAKHFAKDLTDNAASVSGFLYYTDKLVADKASGQLPQSSKSHVWVVHRSEQLSYQQLESLQQNATKLDARIIFVGDKARKGGLQGGAPWRCLMDNGMQTLEMKGRPDKALTLLREQKCEAAIQNLQANNQITEIEDKQSRFEAGAKLVAANPGAVALTINHSERMFANHLIRDALKSNNRLTGDALTVEMFKNIPLSLSQKKSMASYQVGDWIRFNTGIQNSTFKQGSYFKIRDIDREASLLQLENQYKVPFELSLDDKTCKKLSLYRTQSREFQVGERVTWADNTPKALRVHESFKGDAEVSQIQDKQITLRFKDGQSCQLDLMQPGHRHLDYGYAKLLASCTRNSYDKGVLLLDSQGFPQTELTDVYTALSSIKKEPHLLCDNQQGLIEALTADKKDIEYAHQQAPGEMVSSDKDKPFAYTSQHLDGTLARHQTRLQQILPQADQPQTENRTPSTPLYNQAQSAIDFAVGKLSDKEAVFTENQVIDAASSFDVRVPSHYIKEAFQDIQAQGLVLPCPVMTPEGEVNEEARPFEFVTKETYAMEQACLHMQTAGQKAMKPILPAEHPSLTELKNHQRLTDSQKAACVMTLTSPSQLSLIQGIAGAGKTTLLKEIKDHARSAGFELIGLAPTASATNNMKNKTAGDNFNPEDEKTFREAGIPSQTLASFLVQSDKLLAQEPEVAKTNFGANTLVILDEASLGSVRDIFSLMDNVDRLGARCLLLGDDKQLDSVEASRVFHLLLGNGDNTAVMNINTRMQTAEGLALMQAVYANQIDKAFDKLLDNLIEIPDKQERLEAMANYYLSHKPENRDAQVMPMLPLNEDRTTFNELVREGLKAEGTLKGEESPASILVSQDVSVAKQNYALSYGQADWLRFNHDIPRLDIQKGDYLRVEKATHDKVQLINNQGESVHWSPGQFPPKFNGAIEAFCEQDKGIMAGDTIRWRRNFKDKDVYNSENATVKSVTNREALVELNNGSTLTLNLDKKEDQHWDHAYGSTVFVAQGGDKQYPMGNLESAKPFNVSIDTITPGSVVVIPGDKDKGVPSKNALVTEIGTETLKDNYRLVSLQKKPTLEQMEKTYDNNYPVIAQFKQNLYVYGRNKSGAAQLKEVTSGSHNLHLISCQGYPSPSKLPPDYQSLAPLAVQSGNDFYLVGNSQEGGVAITRVDDSKKAPYQKLTFTEQTTQLKTPKEIQDHLASINNHATPDNPLQKLNLPFADKEMSVPDNLLEPVKEALTQGGYHTPGVRHFVKTLDRFSNEDIVKDSHLQVYPNFEKVTPPVMTNMSNFLVQLTRGDHMVSFVDNLEGVKAALRHSQQNLKQTALEKMMPAAYESMKEKVDAMTRDVYGLAKPKELAALAQKEAPELIKDEAPKTQKPITRPKPLRFQSFATKEKAETGNSKKIPETPQTSNNKTLLNFDVAREQQKPQNRNSLETFYRTYYGSADAISLAAISELEYQASEVGISFETSYLERSTTKGKQVRYIDKKHQGKGIVYCNDKSSNGIDYHVITFKTHKGGGHSTTFSGYGWLLEKYQNHKEGNSLNNQKPLDTKTQESMKASRLASQQKEAADRQRSIQTAKNNYRKAQPLEGTLGETYLRQYRGITGPLPSNFRFIKSMKHFQTGEHHAVLIAPARDEKGEITALNRIFLNPDGSKIKSTYQTKDGRILEKVSSKLAQGPSKATTIDVNLGKSAGLAFVSEGTENALTVRETKPNYDVHACIGISNLQHISFRKGTHTVVIVADNDMNNPDTKRGLMQAIDSYKRQGLNVMIALPEVPGMTHKMDLNDVYLREGTEGINRVLSAMEPVQKSEDLGPKNEPLQASFERLKESQKETKKEPVETQKSSPKMDLEKPKTSPYRHKEMGGLER